MQQQQQQQQHAATRATGTETATETEATSTHRRRGRRRPRAWEAASLVAGAKFTKLPCNTLEIAKVFHYSLCGCSRVVEWVRFLHEWAERAVCLPPSSWAQDGCCGGGGQQEEGAVPGAEARRGAPKDQLKNVHRPNVQCAAATAANSAAENPFQKLNIFRVIFRQILI